MKLVAYRQSGRTALGAVDPRAQQVFPLNGHGDLEAADALSRLIAAWPTPGPDSLRTAEDGVALSEVTLEAPLPRLTRNIFCVGKNYREHADEFTRSGFDASDSGSAPSHPIVFTKPPSSVIGPGEPITPPHGLTNAVDYEAELAVIVGTEGRRIPESAAWDHVWGYTILNDVTARDLQHQHKQWFLGKSPDTFCPMGPWAVTADEVDPSDLTVECRVNGELRQRANTKDLIFGIPHLIATLSAGMTLRPGDVIATGTPAGVGIGFTPPRFLRDGDEVSVSITGLGTLTNPVRSAAGTGPG